MTNALPPTSTDALREEVARLRNRLAEFEGHEPTVREEMNYLSSERDRMESERDQARRIAVHLEQENARLTAIVGHLLTNPLNEITHHVWTSDLNALMGGSLDLSDDGVWTVLQFAAPSQGGAR